jgi:hypothetical protein
MSRSLTTSSTRIGTHDNNIILGHDSNPSTLRYDHIIEDDLYERDIILDRHDQREDTDTDNIINYNDVRGFNSYVSMEFKRKFKLFILILILIYYSYINKKQSDSNNWESTRRIGYSEIGIINYMY